MSNPSPLVPLTPSEWEGLSPKAKWDSMVALRGPDMPQSEAIKWFSTSVIRGKLKDCMRVGGAINPDLNLIILPSTGMEWGDEPIKTRKGLRSRLWDFNHFFQHVEEAAGWLGIPAIHLTSYWPAIETGGGIKLASERFLRELTEAPSDYGWKRYRIELERHIQDYLITQYGWKYGSFQPSITDLPSHPDNEPVGIPIGSGLKTTKSWATMGSNPAQSAGWSVIPTQQDEGEK